MEDSGSLAMMLNDTDSPGFTTSVPLMLEVTGGVVSETSMEILDCEVRPAPSVTLYVIVWLPKSLGESKE